MLPSLCCILPLSLEKAFFNRSSLSLSEIKSQRTTATRFKQNGKLTEARARFKQNAVELKHPKMIGEGKRSLSKKTL